MTIHIECFRIIDGKCSIPPKVVAEFDNFHDFGFDIMDNYAWYSYLMKHYRDVKDHHGFQLVYRVRTHGTSKTMFGNKELPPSYYCKTKKRGKNYALNPCIVFFPVDSNYKMLELKKYGRLV